MRTKHLFYTMALASTFAACTNEEVINEAPQLSMEAARPTVADVTLNFGDAESRMYYNDEGKFEWVDGDQIAVMLMDQNNTGVRYGSATKTDDWAQLSWLERYHLVDYVHTNYPFTLENGVWKTDANMLEGNYFLVYPRAEFDGKRQAYFDISEQKQIGNTPEARKEAYAKNQRFIGYARLDAAEGASSLKARMSEILAPVRVNIQSNCTEVSGEPLEIRKIVLTHPTFHSQFSVDPTTADYGNWNLTEYGVGEIELPSDQNASNAWSYDQFFNYANYLTATGIRDSKEELYMHEFEGSVNDEDKVYNAGEVTGNISDKWSEKPENNKRKNLYYYDDAIRAVVKPLWKENWSENVTKFIEVYTYAENGEDAYKLASGNANKLGVVAMVPAFNDWENRNNEKDEQKGTGLALYIYTNKGLVGPVDLSEKQTGNPGSNVQTTDAILAADPRMDMNTVTVIIDDDDIVATPDNKLINNSNDLANYVDYYTKHATNSRVDIEITNDVEIDDALAEKIIAMKEDAGVDLVSLYIKSSDANSKNASVVLKTVNQTKIMEWLDIDENVLVEVAEGAVVDLTNKSRNYLRATDDLNFLVAKGGVLNFVKDMTSVGGWSDVTDYASGALNTIIENHGEVNVVASVDNHAGMKLKNYGKFVVSADAYISLSPESVNQLSGEIVVEKNARLGATSNGKIENRGKLINRGSIFNVKNELAELHPERVLPGIVVVDNADAQTKLTYNKGQVVYNVLPNNKVSVEDNNWNTGMYIYETSTATDASTLTGHHVTDATINNAVMSTSTLKTTLRRLTLNDGASLVGTGDVAEMCFNEMTSANNAAWDKNNKNHLFVTNGDVEIKNVNICFLGNDYNVFLTKGEKMKGVVNVYDNVGFWKNYEDGEGEKAYVDLEAIEMTIKVNSTFTAEAVTADENVTSTIWRETNATLDAKNNSTGYITVN